MSFGERVAARIRQRRLPVQSWFMGINLIMSYWGEGKRTCHHTAPINALYGLYEARVMLAEEGLPVRWQRHAEHGIEIGAGLGELAGKTIRIGLMGTSATRQNVQACRSTLQSCLMAQGWRGQAC